MRTQLYDLHKTEGARFVSFAGWDMPVHYGSQIEEHHAVRQSAGRFDVSHMTIVDVLGPDALKLLRKVLAGDVARLTQGQAQYGLMLNGQGGVIDDLITYAMSDRFRVIFNAARRGTDLSWVRDQSQELNVSLVERGDLSMVAVQGPLAISHTIPLIDLPSLSVLKKFHSLEMEDQLVARTGYTGEDGLEFMLPHDQARGLWQQLKHVNVRAAGLGARDSLRLEAGLNLYGQDMDDSINPFESNLEWTIHWEPNDRDFIGRASLEKLKPTPHQYKLAGLELTQNGVMRCGCQVHTNAGVGQITSGTFSPTLGYSIALARLPRQATGVCSVDIRGKPYSARIVQPPFVRHGKKNSQ